MVEESFDVLRPITCHVLIGIDHVLSRVRVKRQQLEAAAHDLVVQTSQLRELILVEHGHFFITAPAIHPLRHSGSLPIGPRVEDSFDFLYPELLDVFKFMPYLLGEFEKSWAGL
jgi:hypothetical protein